VVKRGTETRLKFKSLKAKLGLSLWQTKGLLQALWDFAGENCPDGDVGRFTNQELALGMEWPADRADEFVAALVETRWLDETKECRLLIHDWEEHCESWVSKVLARRRQKGLGVPKNAGAADNTSRAGGHGGLPSPSHSHHAPPTPPGGVAERRRPPNVAEAAAAAAGEKNGWAEALAAKIAGYLGTSGQRRLPDIIAECRRLEDRADRDEVANHVVVLAGDKARDGDCRNPAAVWLKAVREDWR
jgi:hypothetical protein